jgi:hypothetical protein
MIELFSSGRIADLILALMMLEALILVVLAARVSRGIAMLDVLWNILAGAGLMLALRGALVGLHWGWIATPLLLALGFHGVDVWRRWRADQGRLSPAAEKRATAIRTAADASDARRLDIGARPMDV